MFSDAAQGNIILLPKNPDQVDQRAELGVRDILLIKIAHQTQLDIVRPVGLDLFHPAPTHLNRSIRGVGSVADHKVIKQPSHMTAPMVTIKEPGASLQGAAVMNRNRRPVVSISIGADDLAHFFNRDGLIRPGDDGNRLLPRDKQSLPRDKLAGTVNVIDAHELADFHMVALGNAIQGFTSFDRVVHTAAGRGNRIGSEARRGKMFGGSGAAVQKKREKQNKQRTANRARKIKFTICRSHLRNERYHLLLNSRQIGLR